MSFIILTLFNFCKGQTNQRKFDFRSKSWFTKSDQWTMVHKLVNVVKMSSRWWRTRQWLVIFLNQNCYSPPFINLLKVKIFHFVYRISCMRLLENWQSWITKNPERLTWLVEKWLKSKLFPFLIKIVWYWNDVRSFYVHLMNKYNKAAHFINIVTKNVFIWCCIAAKQKWK